MRDGLQLMPAAYRTDAWLTALFESIATVVSNLDTEIASLPDQIFFDRMDEKQLSIEEVSCEITPVGDISARRAAVEAQWKSDGTATRQRLQAICDSWKNGEVSVSFADGAVRLTFIGAFGTPERLDDLKNAMRRACPAHLPIEYVIRYLMVADVESMTVSALENELMDEFAGG